MHCLERATFLLSSRLQEVYCVFPAIVSLPYKDKLSSFLMWSLCSSMYPHLAPGISIFLLSVPPTISLVFAKAHCFVCILRVRLVSHTYFHTSQALLSISNVFMLCSPSYPPNCKSNHTTNIVSSLSPCIPCSCMIIKMPSLHVTGSQRPRSLRAKIKGQFAATLQCKTSRAIS